LGLLGGVVFVATRHRSVPPAPPAQAHRKQLEFRDGRWYAPGQTNGFNGLLFETYDNGAMKSRSAVSNGWLQGLSQGWHTNGQLQVEEYFVAGLSHGRRTKWYANGAKMSEATIVEGKLHGTFRRWHENGAPAETMEMRQGQPEGLSCAYYPSGFLKAQARLHDGKLVEQRFWQDGQLRSPPQ